jgi:hypothetical protein
MAVKASSIQQSLYSNVTSPSFMQTALKLHFQTSANDVPVLQHPVV